MVGSITRLKTVGIPVIASDIAGRAEIVENDRSGFLVPVGDSWRLWGSRCRDSAVNSLRSDRHAVESARSQAN
jgi:glycosyltransferase involved in cell wall biosynthesis